jgi:hypothetical protein
MLDHAAFPHVFDCVLMHADPALLLRFRLTSRWVCERVDKLLHHVSVTIDGVFAGAWSAPRSTSGAVLARAKVVDTHSPVSPVQADKIRLFPDTAGQLSESRDAGTMVLFCGAARRWAPIISVYLLGQKIVVNLPLVERRGMARWYSWDGHPDLYPPPEDLLEGGRSRQWEGEVVFVFHIVGEHPWCTSDTRGEGEGTEDADDEPEWDWQEDTGLASLTDNIESFVRNTYGQVTVVGFPERLRAAQGMVGADTVRQIILDNIAREGGRVGFTHPPPKILSHAEYRCAVGEAQYALETRPGTPWVWPYTAAPEAEH